MMQEKSIKIHSCQTIEISRSSYWHNLETLKKLLSPECRLMAVVKANAYGHGIVGISKLAQKWGVDALGVNSLEEGITLRNIGISLPVLILGYVPLEEMKAIPEYNLEPTIYNLESLLKLEQEAHKAGKSVDFHLKFETGTNRQGVTEEELDNFLKILNRLKSTRLKGISTHFANIEDTTDHSYAEWQLGNFNRMYEKINSNSERKIIRHTACTAATILFPETHFEMVRAGIGTYGLWPSKETYLSAVIENHTPPKLKPVMRWKTIVSQVKEIPPDSFVGYGCTYKTTHRMRLAVLPVGYFDGYDRRLSNRGYVLIKGKRAPVLGRVCMNMLMVDVTHIKGAKPEDEAVLLGSQGEEKITADEIASICHTINYEIVTRINPNIKRRIVE